MSGKMKNYLGMKKNGFEVIDTTLEKDSTGNQKLLVQKMNPPDQGWIFVLPANKFVAGELPVSPIQKRKSYMLRRSRQIKHKNNKYIVDIAFGDGYRRRIFDSWKEASNFKNKAESDYITNGLIPNKKNVAQHKISNHIYQRNDHGNIRYIFEFRHGNERCCRSFQFKTDALRFEKAFFEKYNPSKPFPTIQIKNYSSTGHKFIHLHKKTYYFEKTYRGERHRKGFHTLSEALAYRNQWLTDHNLPILD